jgi:hypothetical protein
VKTIKTKPRNIRSAIRRGWHLVDLSEANYAQRANTSYLGLQIWADRNKTGRYVSSFMPTKFAFEQAEDALMFKLRFA